MILQNDEQKTCTVSQLLKQIYESFRLSRNLVTVSAMLTDLGFTRSGQKHLKGRLIDPSSNNKRSGSQTEAHIDFYFWSSNFQTWWSSNFSSTKFEEAAALRELKNLSVEVTGKPATFMGSTKLYFQVTNIKICDQKAVLRERDRVRQKIDAEGLIATAKRKALPSKPRRIGVITSPTSVGFQDFRKSLWEQDPFMEIVVLPSYVQGDQAPKQIVQQIESADQQEFDLLALVRGGGDSADLVTFDHYDVVKAMAESRFPFLVAVGHSTDDPLVNLVAQKVCITPTEGGRFLGSLQNVQDLLWQVDRKKQRIFEAYVQKLEELRLHSRYQTINAQRIMHKSYEQVLSELRQLGDLLEARDPRRLLSKGYTIAVQDGKQLFSCHDYNPNRELKLIFADGSVQVPPKS